MKILKTLLASSITLALLGTAGCSDSESQDMQEEDATSFTGLVVDGRIARGFVWLDVDNDDIFDTFEPFAYTDVNGYFGYNPLTNIDYCADDAAENVQQYCLESFMSEEDYTLKITGGIDLDTGTKFTGVMALNGTLTDAKEVAQQISEISESGESKPDFIPVVSPLTSIIAGATIDEQVTILTNFGISGVTADNVSAIINNDYTDYDSANDDAAAAKKVELATLAFQFEKVIEVLSVILDTYLAAEGVDLSEGADGGVGIGSTTALIRAELIKYLLDPELLSDSNKTGLNKTNNYSVKEVGGSMSAAGQFGASAVGATFLYHGVVRSIPTSITTELTRLDDVAELGGESANSVAVMIGSDNDDPAEAQQNLEAIKLASQVLVETNINNAEELTSSDPTVSGSAQASIEKTADLVSSDEFQTLMLESVTNGTTVDVEQLADEIEELEDGDSLQEAFESSTLAEAPAEGEVGIWAQRVLSMSGKSEDGDAAGRILIFFGAENDTSISGDVSICYAYNSDNDDDDISTTYISGTWQELNARGIVQLNQALVSFNIKAQKQAIIPADEINSVVGLGTIDPTALYGHLRFTDDDNSSVWYSDLPVQDETDKTDFGLVNVTTVPTTPEQCEAFSIGDVDNVLLKNLGSF